MTSSDDPQQPPYGQDPYPQQPQQPQQPYGQQPQHPQQPWGQQYPQQYPQQPYAKPPTHSSATTSMVLGVVALAGILFCAGVTLVLSPFAWAMGSKALREIDADPAAWSGRDQANTGRITGIIGTILLVIGVLLVVGFIVLAVVGVGMSSSVTTGTRV